MARIIHYYNLGLLTLPDGQTLRSYISKKVRRRRSGWSGL